MAKPDENPKPAPLPEVDVNPADLAPAPDDSAQYQSSEQIQRAHAADVFSREEAKKKQTTVTQQQKLDKLLDAYIKKHSSTVSVRKMAEKSKKVEKYGADYQLDLSADIVEILEKIKEKLG